ncbi:MAG: 3'-5' exonuclease [Thermoleophilia bacterium]|nr:3'-5' exonuclease [Thermoleophilia bacterium]
MTRYAILDLETTGLDERAGDRVIELAVLLVDEHLDELDRLESLVAIDTPVAASHVHGITDIDLVGAPTFADLAWRVGELLEGAVVVGHYPRFDLRFLDAELQRIGMGLPTTSVIDTRDTSRAAGIVGRLRMVDCCRELGVRNDNPHTAMGDVLTTRALLGACQTRGVQPLDHARRFTARVVGAAWPIAPHTTAGRTVDLNPRTARIA